MCVGQKLIDESKQNPCETSRVYIYFDKISKIINVTYENCLMKLSAKSSQLIRDILSRRSKSADVDRPQVRCSAIECVAAPTLN